MRGSAINDRLQLRRETTRYSLASRGVRVVSGRSENVEAADSNGAGKSALVMAPAWALTGRSDARAEVRVHTRDTGIRRPRHLQTASRCDLHVGSGQRVWQASRLYEKQP